MAFIMKCDICSKESHWLESIGPEFVCRKCISKHKLIGLILRTHMDTFRFIIRKLNIDSYEKLTETANAEIENIVDLKILNNTD